MTWHSDKVLIKPESEDLSVWRYLTFDKFQSLIEERAIYFTKISKFQDDDPHEGSLPLKEKDYHDKLQINNALKDIKNGSIGISLSNIEGLTSTRLEYTNSFYASCWHINEYENIAMWKLYCSGTDYINLKSDLDQLPTSLAIRCNIKQLRGIFEEIPHIKFQGSKVRYIDYENAIFHDPIEYNINHVNLRTPLIHKRIEFINENEYRILANLQNGLTDTESDQIIKIDNNGIFIPIKIEKLITRIVLSPWSPPDHKDNIIELLRSASLLPIPFIENSKIKRSPLF